MSEELKNEELDEVSGGKKHKKAHKIDSCKCAVCNGTLCEYKGFYVCKEGHVFNNSKAAVSYETLIRTDTAFAKEAWANC